MGQSDTKRSILNDIWIAFGLLTRLPLPEPVWPEARVAANAAWAYPLAGLGVALLSGVVAWGLLYCGLPASYAAGMALLMSVLATGAMHEDGLADCADGFWGGWDRERRLKIMKDSNTGAYGVSALILAYGLRWAALSTIFAQGWIFIPLVAAAVTSRAAMVLCMATLPNARADGLSSTTGRPSMSIAGAASLWALVVCGLGFGLTGTIPLIIAVVAAIVWGLVAMRKIGGQTGDVLGATQQICEVAVLGALAALL